MPLSDTYANAVVNSALAGQILTFTRADGATYQVTLPGRRRRGDDAYDWATEGNTDILPGSKLPSDIENVDNSDITYIDATVSSFASRLRN